MTRAAFERLVVRAFKALPTEFAGLVANTAIEIYARPAPRHRVAARLRPSDELLGLYEGVPQTDRADGSPLYPDRITLFQRAIEAEARRTRHSVLGVVRTTLAHEIGHHFGLDEQSVRALERRESHRRSATMDA